MGNLDRALLSMSYNLTRCTQLTQGHTFCRINMMMHCSCLICLNAWVSRSFSLILLIKLNDCCWCTGVIRLFSISIIKATHHHLWYSSLVGYHFLDSLCLVQHRLISYRGMIGILIRIAQCLAHIQKWFRCRHFGCLRD